MARPSSYNHEIADEICNQMAQGKSLRQVCEADGMPAYQTVLRWADQHDAFRDQYARAREAMFDWIAHEIIKISDDASGDYFVEDRNGVSVVVPDHARVQRARLQVDSRKWLLSKVAPRKYGDKPEEPSDLKPQGFVGRIERVIISTSPQDPPPVPPAQIAYQPTRSPDDLTPQENALLFDVLELLKRTIPTNSDRPPGEVFEVVKKALLAHFSDQAEPPSAQKGRKIP